MTPAMNFEVALDLLIATAITCLRHDNPKLRRAVEIAINYRELFPTTPPAISLQQLGRGDDLRIEGIPNGRQIRFKADFWRVSFGRRSTSG